MTSTDAPRRGEVWLTAFGAARHGEPGKTRPAVVLTPSELTVGSDHEQIVVIPLSASVSSSPLRPVISTASGVDLECRAVPRAVQGVARSRLIERIGRVSEHELGSMPGPL
ncbi:MAG: type II toxin-antitoxin system PemK/MazF family toxin [Solirubrobacterales bacterium]|nr:type II toxin-antitoxin system PemK/MazF family toxin [Solirubrobacterales bacterium]